MRVRPSSLDLSKCYAIVILVLSILYNYMWASLTSFKGADPQMEMELFYTFLYAVSIIILLVFITPSILSQIQLRWKGQYFWRKMPKFLSGLHRLAKIHLMITNIAIWLKILTKETVVYTLEYHEVTNSSTEVNTKYLNSQEQTNLTIPNFGDPCQAYKCFSHKNMTCPTKNTLWTLEQGFSCPKTYFHHYGSIYYPFFNEFCLLMACVFYEMFSAEDPDEEDDVDVRDRNPDEDDHDNAPLLPAPVEEGALSQQTRISSTYQLWQSSDIGMGLLIGCIPVIGVIVIWATWVNPSDQIVSMSNINFFLLIPLMVATLVTLVITTTSNLDSSAHGNHDVDKSILFVTFFGVVMLNVAFLLASPHDKDNEESIFFGLNLLTIVAAFLQVVQICLLQSTRLTAEFKTTRNLLVIIAAINIAFWIQTNLILNDLHLSIKDLGKEFIFFGPYGWVVIWRVAQPLTAFFRFHSALLLGQAALAPPSSIVPIE